MFKSCSVLVGSVIAACVAVGCSAAPPETATQSKSSVVSGTCAIGGGQCVIAVQDFYRRFGITVGRAGDTKADDADGRTCDVEGACLIWINDVPSSYGWVRTDSPSAYDIAIFPPNTGNSYGHIAIVEHVDGDGVWMIDSNDANTEVANNTPHLHSTAP